MATSKTRLQITLAPDVGPAIKLLAKRDRVPAATKAAQLLRQAIEMEEDLYLSKIAEERDVPGAKWLTEKEFWKAAMKKK
ncbi:hypothetical protein HYW60_01685 [Candidatus Kaiserbacteria bacterium]|nr:hypothetical protein [Candidatus Kaiserbacteria bacterium]